MHWPLRTRSRPKETNVTTVLAAKPVRLRPARHKFIEDLDLYGETRWPVRQQATLPTAGRKPPQAGRDGSVHWFPPDRCTGRPSADASRAEHDDLDRKFGAVGRRLVSDTKRLDSVVACYNMMTVPEAAARAGRDPGDDQKVDPLREAPRQQGRDATRDRRIRPRRRPGPKLTSCTGAVEKVQLGSPAAGLGGSASALAGRALSARCRRYRGPGCRGQRQRLGLLRRRAASRRH